MSVSRHDGLLVDMINESIEEIIIHVTRFRILHVNRIDLVQRRTTVNEDGGAEVDIILS